MAVHDEVYSLASAFAGTLTAARQSALDRLCQGAERSLAARLRTGVTVEDCGACFVTAAAWMALAAYGAGRDGDGVESFAASDLSLSCRSDGGEALRKQAEEIMGPYLSDGFAFLGVET